MGGSPKPKVDQIKDFVLNRDPSREDKLGEDEHEINVITSTSLLTSHL